MRCSPSSRTQRTSRAPSGNGIARTSSTTSRMTAAASSGSGTPTNRRRPGTPAWGSPEALTGRLRQGAPANASRSPQPRGPVVAQHLERGIVVAPADDVDRLVLERLVGLEEMLDLDEAVRADLLEPLDVLLVGVAQGDAQHLEVEALLVAHLEPADRARPHVAAGERRLVDDEKGVGVIAVAGACALDEAVVEVVEDRAAQDAIEPEDAGRPRRTRTCCATRAGSRPRSRRQSGYSPGLRMPPV